MIRVDDLSIRQGAFRLEGISFEVPAGGYGVLMGRTGCGKTTILEALCGLRPVERGRIVLGGQDVTGWGPADRGVGYVPQDGVLFSTMTVRDHLAFGPEIRRWPRADVAARVEELAALLGLGALLDRWPPGLSGGERQRVALGRALASRPAVLCLDEPLSALDDETRDGMVALLQSVRRPTGATILHVTHSAEDARRLADRVLRIQDGRIVGP
jgi:ABC-type sugar transport system ATPase subunit